MDGEGYLTADQVIADLRARCQTQGSQVAFAERLGLSVGYVNDILQGRKGMSPIMARRLGYDTHIRFTKATRRSSST